MAVGAGAGAVRPALTFSFRRLCWNQTCADGTARLSPQSRAFARRDERPMGVMTTTGKGLATTAGERCRGLVGAAIHGPEPGLQ